jgi:hypothetical protein
VKSVPSFLFIGNMASTSLEGEEEDIVREEDEERDSDASEGSYDCDAKRHLEKNENKLSTLLAMACGLRDESGNEIADWENHTVCLVQYAQKDKIK